MVVIVIILIAFPKLLKMNLLYTVKMENIFGRYMVKDILLQFSQINLMLKSKEPVHIDG